MCRNDQHLTTHGRLDICEMDFGAAAVRTTFPPAVIENVVLDPNSNSIGRWRILIVFRNIDTGLDGQDHPRLEGSAIAGLEVGTDVVHIETEPMARPCM